METRTMETGVHGISVIKATGRLEFENDFRTRVQLVLRSCHQSAQTTLYVEDGRASEAGLDTKIV